MRTSCEGRRVAWRPKWSHHRGADTSPRGEGVPGDPDGGWDFGPGAGLWL